MSVPEPRGLPVVGHTLSFFRDPFGFYERAGELGDVVRTEIMGEEIYQIRHPDTVKRVFVDEHERFRKGDLLRNTSGQFAPDGLFMTEGEQWKRQRETVQPAFYRDRIEGYVPEMVAAARRVTDGWRDGEIVAVDEVMRELTLEIIARTMFGTDDPDHLVAVADAAAAITDRFEAGMTAFLPAWVPTPTNRRYRRASDRLDEVIDELRAEADLAGDGPPDLLSILVASDLPDEEIRDQLVTFLFAGHETTSLALTYTWHLLSQHPNVRERLHEEVDALDGPLWNGQPRSADPSLSEDDIEYTARVVDESLRLYPPAYNVFRQADEPVELRGYELPAGATLSVPIHRIHRDGRFYDAPETFDPDRWPAGPSHEYAYLPFGAGPRHCIGMRFALLELRVALADIARRWRLEPFGGLPDLRMSITLQPSDSVDFRVRKR